MAVKPQLQLMVPLDYIEHFMTSFYDLFKSIDHSWKTYVNLLVIHVYDAIFTGNEIVTLFSQLRIQKNLKN